MSKVVKQKIYTCKSCGAKLEFDPAIQQLKCVKCGASYLVENDSEITKHVYNEKEVDVYDATNESLLFKCKSCGATLNMDTYQIASTCQYCESPFVVEKTELPGLKPDAVVPFTITKQNASATYQKSIKKKWFLPNKFKKNVPITSVEGLYISAFGFDADSYSSYDGVLETEYTDKDGDTHTSTQHIRGKINLTHRDVLVENYNKMEQAELEKIEPFNLSETVAYDNSYVQGYSMSYYNEQVSYSHKKAERRMNNVIRSRILSRYSYDHVRYLNISTDFTNNKYSYYLLPMYRIKHIYKGKEYYNYLNGQTGKTGGKVPRSPVKITFFVLFIILAILGFVLLFNIIVNMGVGL